MLKKIFFIIGFILFTGSAMASENVFSHPSTSQNIAKNMPVLKDASCKFTQEKTLPAYNSVLKSGGNFKFIQNKGVIFETEYPIKAVSSYTTGQNKHVSDIILAISKKNYSYLDKNFNMFYISENGFWTVGLRPKNNSLAQLESIIVAGKIDINRIKITTTKSGVTDILFQCGK